MPIYEYECRSCGHYLEALQKIEAAPLRKCPECGRARLQRLLSAPRFRLKGGGWYETDFKKDRQRNLADRPDNTANTDKTDKPGKPGKAGKEAAETADGASKPEKKQAGKSKAESGQAAA